MGSVAMLRNERWYLMRTSGFVVAVLGFVLCSCELRAQANFQVDVNFVVLHVTVTDHRGRFIHDLPQSAFHVFEDGVPQSVTLFQREDAPVAVGLVIDNSGSMRRKLQEVVAAAVAFARSSNPEDQMFVVNFNEHVSLGLPAGKAFVSNPVELDAAMRQIYTRGETALYDAVAAALGHIRESPLPRKVLIVLSDGGDNASTLRLPGVLAMVQQSDVVVYAVGLFDEYDNDRNPGVLKELAKVSGGEAFFPKQVPNVTNVLQVVSRNIRNQYTVGYVPASGKGDGSYRNIRVTLTGPHTDRWIVHTRTGYVAPWDLGDRDTLKAREK